MGDRARTYAAGMRHRHRPWGLLAALIVAAALALALASALPAGAQEEPDFQIIGGSQVPNGKYPFMVSIQTPLNRNLPDGHFCGGTLIDRDSVLTAGHCTDFIAANTTESTLSFRSIRLVVGRTVLTTDQGQVRKIERLSDLRIHPRYRATRNTLRYDAAVIELNRPVRGIEPIGLDAAGSDALERPGSRATVAGWGNIIEQGPNFEMPDKFPRRMREAPVPFVSDAEAARVYESQNINYVSSIMVAAGKSGRDTCQGDSGGPLFKRTAGSGFTQIGITSFGIGCGTARYPGVYAEVSNPSIGRFIRNAAESDG